MKTIKNIINKLRKLKLRVTAVATVFTLLLIGGATALLLPDAQAQPSAGGIGYYTPTLAVNSASTTATNSHFGPTTNGIWPQYLQGGDLTTNFTKVDVSYWKDVSIQFSGSAPVSIGAVPSQSVILTVYRSISGGSPTNGNGGGVLWDTLGTITLPCTLSTSGPWTVISNYCNQISPIAGVTTLYIGKMDAGALTNAIGFTNYTVRVSGK